MNKWIILAAALALNAVGCGDGGAGEIAKLRGQLESKNKDAKTLEQKLAEREREKAAIEAEFGEALAREASEKETLRLKLVQEREELELKQSEELAAKEREKAALNAQFGETLDAEKNEKERLRLKLEQEREDLKSGLLEKLAERERERDGVRDENLTLREQLKRQARERESLQSINDVLKNDLSKSLDPIEQFKKESQEYIANLGPRKLFEDRKEDQFSTFKKKLAYLADTKRLMEPPAPASLTLTLPLPLVFDGAPRANRAFSLYVSESQGEIAVEEKAKFILATDDRDLLGDEGYEFRVPASFPVLYLGKSMFMLPKMLFDPLYANDKSMKLIPLVYDFESDNDQPLGYETYLESLAEFEAQTEVAKGRAFAIRQKQLEAKMGVATSL